MSDASQERINQDYFTDVKEFEGTSDLQGSSKWEEISGKKSFENDKFLPYKDSDVSWVIGYGTKIEEENLDHYRNGITKEEADSLLTERLDDAQRQAASLVFNFTELPEDVQEVLTDLTFNMGYGTVNEEFPSFLNAIEEGDYPMAMAHLKYRNPDSLGLKASHKDDTGDEYSNYYKTHTTRGVYNLDKIERAYQESLDVSTDDGVFNMLLDKDAFE